MGQSKAMAAAYQRDGACQVYISDGQVVQQAQSSLLLDGGRADKGSPQAMLHGSLDGLNAVELLH